MWEINQKLGALNNSGGEIATKIPLKRQYHTDYSTWIW